MKVTLTQNEVFEAVKEWCSKRFPLGEKTTMVWKTTTSVQASTIWSSISRESRCLRRKDYR